MGFKQARRIVESLGWKLDRVRGSHYIYTKDGVEFILPQHRGDIPRFILKRIRLMEQYESDKYLVQENTIQ
jgi:predicted RNA binding protein YcfA (HicA-like mRNA interferase family)